MNTPTTPQLSPDQEMRAERAIQRWKTTVPRRFAAAEHAAPEEIDPGVRRWVAALLRAGMDSPAGKLEHGPSLFLIGGTGPGKSFVSWWALYQLARYGVVAAWTRVRAGDLYASLRPQPNVNTEEEFWRYARAPLLVLDDWGTQVISPFTREVDNRLIDHRYEWELPTLITTNLMPARVKGKTPPEEKVLTEEMDDRVRSRLVEMCGGLPYVMAGEDRRRAHLVQRPEGCRP